MESSLWQDGIVVHMVGAVVVDTESTASSIATGVLRCLLAAHQTDIEISCLHYRNSAVW